MGCFWSQPRRYQLGIGEGARGNGLAPHKPAVFRGELAAPSPSSDVACARWAEVTKGRQTWKFGDRKEVFEAGDAFYVEPGHIPVFEGRHGSDSVQLDRLR